MQIKLPYGNTDLAFHAPDSANVLYSGINQLKSEQSGEDIVRASMSAPIDSPRLRDLAAGKRTCTVIISDHTRPVPSRDILPPMLEELRSGNPDIQITLLVATGLHRTTNREELVRKLGEEIASRETIVVHDCRENNVPVGILPSGAPLVIDRLAAETDLLVAEGFIEPHFFAGFSGGRKSVLPGVCDRKTVLGNHCSTFIDSPFARTGKLDGNPIHRDMIAAAKMVNLAYIVNVVIDEQKRTVAAFSGSFEAAHRQGCEFLQRYCRVNTPLSDIAITTNGGAPLDQNLYQCVKCLTAAEAAVRPGGVIIACAECADGIGGDSFYRSLSTCESAAALYADIMATSQQETILDQWQSQILARVLMHYTVIMVTREELAETVREMKMLYARTPEEAMETARRITGPESSVTVIPNGVSIIVN